jgi:prepilin-type N-terminal cleavage/methylation domain-containing protein
MLKSKKLNKAFTLVEILVVIAVIGLLSSIIFAITQGANEQGRIARGLQFSKHLENSLGAYLVGRWNFDDQTSFDASGWGNHGIIYNATYANDTPSSVGYSLLLNGADSYMDLSQPLTIFNKSFTVTMWIKGNPEISGRWGILLGDYNLGGVNVNFELHTSGKTRFYWGGEPDLMGTKDLLVDSWHFIVFVRDKEAGNVKSYVDAEIDINYAGSISDKIATVVHRIGRDARTGDTAFGPGKIDEVCLYESALTAEQIRFHYYAGLDSLLSRGLVARGEYQERLAFNH